MTTPATVQFGERELAWDGPYIGSLRDANGLLDDPQALRARLAEDGYLLVRGLHRREAVLAARAAILAEIAQEDAFLPGTRREQAVINPARRAGAFVGGQGVTRLPAFLDVVEGRPIMEFFHRLFGEPAMTFDYKWMRFVGHGDFTGAHMDNVYMGRGSQRLYTVWTPLGDVPITHGPLALLLGSHALPGYARVRDTYGQMDVDRDRVGGWFSNDPVELVDRFGGRWASSAFAAGDCLIFGMYTMHGSLSNVSDRYRLSCDTRYQPASEPADERWVGATPKAHYAWHSGPQVPMSDKRREWGV